jgi:hypothetical protein
MRDELSSIPALLAATYLALSACGGTAPPSADAVEGWLARTTSGDPKNTPERSPSEPPLPQIAKRISITIERAEGLPDLDDGPGETDPYAIIEYEGARYRSSVVEGSLDPIWGDTFVLDVTPGGILTLKLMDEDALASDEQLGVLSETLPPLAIGETRTLTFAFRGGAGGRLTLTATGLVRP